MQPGHCWEPYLLRWILYKLSSPDEATISV